MENKNFEVIPAIDLLDDKVTMLTMFKYNTAKYCDRFSIDVAKEIESVGLKSLHLIDLNGAKDGYNKNLDSLQEILYETDLRIDFGGGLRNRKQIERILNMGVEYANISSLAIVEPEKMKELISEFGAGNFSLGLDVKGEKCYTNGGRLKSDFNYNEILDYYKNLGIKRFNVTSMDYDGTLAGIDIDLYKNINNKYSDLEIIASGGVKDKQDIINATKLGCSGIIVGSAFYFGRMELKDLEKN